MSARSYELVWAAELLECLPQVDLESFRTEAGPIWVDDAETGAPTSVPGITLTIRATGLTGARLLADALSLQEGEATDGEDGYGLLALHHWSGWVAEASHVAAVWVEISACERVWQAVA
jgi:hypothetical protein